MRTAVAAMMVAWAGLVVPRVAWSARQDALVRCESSARETTRCKADTRGGVTLERQLSRAGCWYDETWGYDAKGVWVSNGCRADFALGRSAPEVGTPSGSSAASESSSGSGLSGTDVAMGAAAVLVVGAIAAAVLANRNDDDDGDRDRCRHRDRRGRCLDDDEDDSGYGSGDPWSRDRLVKCESQGHKERYCRVDTRRGVELYRQLSEARCRYGSSWGYDRRGIWVDRGCRADFRVRR